MSADTLASFHESAVRILEGQGNAARLRQPDAATQSFPDSQWRQLAQAGWLRILVPQEHGGLGLGIQELGAIFRAVGTHLVRGPLLDHAVSIALLMAHVSEPARKRLDAALDGEKLIACARSLPPPHGEGAELTLRGDRLWGVAELVGFGQWADELIVFAQDRGECVLVLASAQTCSRQPCASVDPCVQYCRIELRGLQVRPEDVLVRGPAASQLLGQIEDIQRLMMAAEISAGVQALVDMSIEYAKLRRQFGRAIGSFQALAHMLAELAAKCSALGHLVTACMADAVAEPARLHALALVAKSYACTVGRYAAQEALQVHGGIGFTNELTLHLFYRRILTHQGFLGETDALLCELGASQLAGDAPIGQSPERAQ